MSRNVAFWMLWIGFILYALLFAPPDRPDTLALLQNLSTGKWQGINPIIVALFYLLGIWPLIYACLLFIDGRMQKVAAWPFVLVSFGVGAFALLPYLALRQPNGSFSGQKDVLLKLMDSRWIGIALTLAAGMFVAYGLIGGDWSNFGRQWQTSRFVHVMSLDFCLVCLLFPTLLKDDMARRGLKSSTVFWAVALIPLLGPLAYLSLRPPLEVSPAANS